MFELAELQQLGYFLSKANLTGAESVAHATLLIKIQRIVQALTEQAEAAQAADPQE